MSNSEDYQHLIVCAHGIHGQPADFSYLHECIQSSSSSYGRIYNLVTSSTTGKTKEGIETNAQRIIEEIKQCCLKMNKLKYISLVGFSLGGLFLRYAIKELYDPATHRIANLEPIDFVTIATPHLGVWSYNYLHLPKFFIPVVAYFMGKSGYELFLIDQDKISREQEDCLKTPLLFTLTNPLYLQSLSAFKRRHLYATLRKDFSVPVETAAIDPFISKDSICKQASSHWPHRWFYAEGSIIMEISNAHDSAFSFNSSSHDEVLDAKDASLSKEREYYFSFSSDTLPNRIQLEKEMAYRLNSVGWSKVIVDFPILFPSAHTQINACGGGSLKYHLNSGGRPIMDHLVNFLLKE
ncbi:serine esterase (DUF676) protein [Cardiosporidium cionae]|uniref:Serine esterase (DUF676) protein n=1 Tax=Cardiosporidium cionae TaxID=476202 RepID=A0ABQ7J9I0_9APIC|nr:serine esterase (DUF676) protein [Cardiosporidium cionae]|eukprot:KAF8820663.1 serine esterase (DUF676) protein [Cardiosporidium cionae]